MEDHILKTIQWLVLISGVIDSFKYKFITQKISRYKSSKEQSRKMLNLTLFKNLVLGIYSHYFLKDWYITASCVVALYTAGEAFYFCYLHYPYKNRKKKGYKRPSIYKYTIHSLTPNKWAKKL